MADHLKTPEETTAPVEAAAPVEPVAAEPVAAEPAAAEGSEAAAAPSKLAGYHLVGIVLAAVALLAGAGVGLAMGARPTESLVEKRVLASFPEWDTESFLSGWYFNQVETWYSDTYPVREPMVAMNQSIEKLYGITPEVGFTGGDVVADELPVEEDLDEEKELEERKEVVIPYPLEPVETPDVDTWGAQITEVLMRGLYTQDGKCYGLFYFNQEAANRYTAAVNLAAQRLEGKCTVYSMLAPMSSAIYLDDELVASLGGSNQRDALAYYYSQLSDDVNLIKIYDTLEDSKDDYIYFGTDHHWTMRGAYEAYVELCDVMGLEVVDALNKWDYIEYSPFQGSYATGLDGQTVLEPDTVEAWVPEDTNDQLYWDWDGALEPKGKYNIINDLNLEAKSNGHYGSIYKHEDSAGFATFGGGDWALVRIENPNIDDGSTLLIVKDSFGDAVYPLMVSHYQHIYVIDFRYFDNGIVKFALDHDVDDVIFINCLAVTSTPAASDVLWNRIVDDTSNEVFEGLEDVDEATGVEEDAEAAGAEADAATEAEGAQETSQADAETSAG